MGGRRRAAGRPAGRGGGLRGAPRGRAVFFGRSGPSCRGAEERAAKRGRGGGRRGAARAPVIRWGRSARAARALWGRGRGRVSEGSGGGPRVACLLRATHAARCGRVSLQSAPQHGGTGGYATRDHAHFRTLPSHYLRRQSVIAPSGAHGRGRFTPLPGGWCLDRRLWSPSAAASRGRPVRKPVWCPRASPTGRRGIRPGPMHSCHSQATRLPTHLRAATHERWGGELPPRQ